MRCSRFPIKRQRATPVGDVAARHIVTDTRTAGSRKGAVRSHGCRSSGAATGLATETASGRPEKGACVLPSATEPAEATGMLDASGCRPSRSCVPEKRMHCSGRREESRRWSASPRGRGALSPADSNGAAPRQSPLVRERGGSLCASLEGHWIAV